MRCWLVIVLILFPLWTSAQKTESVTAKYTYYAPENVSIEEAKQISLERAKIQSIADHFGTVVTQSNSTIVSNNNGHSESSMISLGGSELKGEWVETTQAPSFNIYYQQNMLVVEVSVKGKIREITQKDYNLDVKVLRNGLDLKNEQYEFVNGDDMFLSFRSPMNGFLAVYLLDEQEKKVYCLLPYRNSDVSSWPIKRDQRYVFFSSSTDKNADEYTMTCANAKDFNQLICLFSTNDFVKAQTEESSSALPRELPYAKFVKWLASLRTDDCNLSVVRKEIVISPQTEK